MEIRLRTIKIVAMVLGAVIIATVGFGVVQKAMAQIGTLINFAGKVTNLDGSELADGVYDFRFRLYDAPTGGNLLWTENLTSATRFSGTIASVSTVADGIRYGYSGASATSTFRIGQYLSLSSTTDKALIVDYNGAGNTVTVASGSPVWTVGAAINNRPFVEGGVIDINLGSVTDLSGVDFSQARYLEIVFNGETMQPRKLFTEVPRAIDSIQLGGKTEAEFGSLAENESIAGEWNFNNIVDISTTSSQTALTVTQNGNGNIVDFVGTSSTVSILADGRLRIGDYTLPASRAGSSAGYVLKTDINGNMYWGDDLEGAAGGYGLWSSSTVGIIRLNDTAQTVVIGNTGTTSPYNVKLEVEGYSWFDNVGISSGQQLRLFETDNTNYVAFRASTTLASNIVLTLPSSLGSNGLALVTDGNGNLRWDAASGFAYVNAGAAGQVPFYASNGSVLSGTSSMFIAVDGKIGIGTTAPAYSLDVNGDVRISGNLIANNINTGTTTTNYAQVKIVAKSGADFVTIQAAIDSLTCSSASPCLVKVMPGVYAEQVTINNKSYIDIIADGGPEVTIIRPTGVAEAVIISGSAGNVRVEGFSVELAN